MHTHSSEHTHTLNTHLEQWAAIYAVAPREQLGLLCLDQGHLSRGIDGGETAGYSIPPPTIPTGPRLELATFVLQVQLSNHEATTLHVYYNSHGYFSTLYIILLAND